MVASKINVEVAGVSSSVGAGSDSNQPSTETFGLDVCDIPIPVTDSESIVRAIKRPSHTTTKKGKEVLKSAAFKAAPERDDVSVMRHTYMGTQACREKAASLVEGNDRVKYVGLAVLSASQIRQLASDVIDSREEFCGHAHISHGVVLTRDEPPDSVLTMALNERLREMIAAATFYPDPSIEMDKWAEETVAAQ
ncbi:hypothetical protein [Cupriavidus basilensis]|uniref:hypothetical protein n=1 Tax=Cupriavidus basilensis TaxID=68895 RepID=UPI00157A2B43|nr:hypothetical protein [Cupriavidus basilensis]NUA26139.1 hypothetical protein [Cupriavidus basilensis]